jgi:hypothetical protein
MYFRVEANWGQFLKRHSRHQSPWAENPRSFPQAKKRGVDLVLDRFDQIHKSFNMRFHLSEAFQADVKIPQIIQI